MTPKLIYLLLLLLWTLFTDGCAVERRQTIVDRIRNRFRDVPQQPAEECKCGPECNCRKRFFPLHGEAAPEDSVKFEGLKLHWTDEELKAAGGYTVVNGRKVPFNNSWGPADRHDAASREEQEPSPPASAGPVSKVIEPPQKVTGSQTEQAFRRGLFFRRR